MLIYDISREIMSARVYEGDPKPKLEFIKNTSNGDAYNLSQLTLCSHSGTHIDAPKHFDEDGYDITGMKMSLFYGKCTVVKIDGVLTGEDMEALLPHCEKRLILHGDGHAYLSASAARVIADSRVVLVGTDALSIAPSFDEYNTHMELARKGIAVLEGLYLNGVKDGTYTLCALPIKVKGAEAAPCRAVLIDMGKGY